MNNNLEKFIQKNRREFDTESPSDNVWDAIEKTVPAKKEAKIFSMRDMLKWSAAAVVFFVALTAIYFIYIKKYSHDNSTAKNQEEIAVKTVTPDELSGIAPEHASEFKKIYNSIASSQEQLKNAAAGQPELYKQFLNDLAVLDSSYRSLRNQALVTPNRDVIIKAMMQNLQLQAELIYRQLTITNEIKQQKTKQNEKVI
jgi:hypothetical protein